jgi:hypothetical protein
MEMRERAELAAARRLKPSWVESSIGPMPDDANRRRQWERALQDLVSYRHRFGVRDPERALGGPPRSREEGAARARAEAALGRLDRARGAAERSLTRADRGIELSL